ncbi:MAG: histidine kinase, partial [Candidatus Binatia bacterium]
DETLGVITCMGRQPRRLTDHELRLIASMSSQIAVAVVNSRYFEQTKEQASQLRQLTAHLETVREQERVRLSRELHDELGQALTGLKFDVAWINGRLSDAQSPLAARLAIMSDSLDNTIDAIRKISTRLRPDILDKLGLSAAIEWQLQEFRQRTGIQFHFDSYLTDIRLSEQHSTALFRILQEALTNVARHSHASRVRIALEIDNEEVFLRVADDGVGIEEDNIFVRQSLVILGMRERAVSMG